MSTSVYAAGTIFVSNTRPGQRIEVRIQGVDVPACWSLGDPNEANSSGVTLLVNQGNVRAQRFSVTPGMVLLETPADSTLPANNVYVITTYVGSEQGVSVIALTSLSDPDVIVKFAFGGSEPVQLSQGPVLVSWPSV
ncbi:MAG: hypothetical protein K2P84_04005 [Undibacterium sp.]|nr:hypothetical protein [Undibacterium sp.]